MHLELASRVKARLATLAFQAWCALLATKPAESVLAFMRHVHPRLAAPRPSIDVVFVLPPAGAQGWILDAMCREVAARLTNSSVAFCCAGEPLPSASCYFFSHYMYFVRALTAPGVLWRARSHVFITHLEAAKHGIPDRAMARLLRLAASAICMNRQVAHELQRLGTPATLLHVAVGAASSSIYRPHARTPDGCVGFCSAFYARKNPELMLGIVRELPHRQFILLGKGWRQYPAFPEFEAQPNFHYVEVPYQSYPAWYAKMTVFVTVSDLEGGPIPLVEAMMSNVVPVASNTGFAPDLIESGKNGFLVDANASAPDIAGVIEKAFLLQTDIRRTALHCDWTSFSDKIAGIMGLRPVQSGDAPVPHNAG